MQGSDFMEYIDKKTTLKVPKEREEMQRKIKEKLRKNKSVEEERRQDSEIPRKSVHAILFKLEE